MKVIKNFFVGMLLSIYTVLLSISLVLAAMEIAKTNGWYAVLMFILWLLCLAHVAYLWWYIGKAISNMETIDKEKRSNESERNTDKHSAEMV